MGQEIHEYNKALIWRGMQHQWTYNHRANRLGNYVTMDNGGQAVHTSATGLGNDSTIYVSHYTYVESPDIIFKEVPVTIRLNGKEGTLLNKVEEVYVPAPKWMRNKTVYHAIINGYEIKSLLKADQLQLFRFLVDDVEYSRESNEIKLRAHFNLSTNCRTIECPVFSNKTAYELTLNILIMAFDDVDANIVNTYSARNYVWDEKIEIEDRSQRVIALGQKNNVFPKAAIGIKGLGIILDEEHWILEMNQYVVPYSYDAESGVLISDTNLKYVEWKKGMHQFAVAPFKAKFAKRRNGYALLDMNLAMLQFKNATVKHGKSRNTMFWKGWNRNATSNESKGTVDLSSFINDSN
jgi:hypothetical protein